MARYRFYPDFVAELTDGRLFVVEHKGAFLSGNDDSKEKLSVGDLWQAKSGGKGVFLMTVVEPNKPGIYEQINAALG